MTLCPIAIVAGCARCPVVKVCPVKTIIGDAKPPEPEAKGKGKAK
jgi:hypothetical protein